MQCFRYELTAASATNGLIAGCIAGASLVTLAWYVPIKFLGADPGILGVDWSVANLVFTYALIVLGGGLIIVGVPAWVVLHRLGRRDWRTALLLGSSAAPLTYLAVSGIYPVAKTAWNALLLALLGAAVAWVVWRIAYRRSMPPKDKTQLT